jgi:hypothetical protein
MADIDISQAEAEALIAMEKHSAKTTTSCFRSKMGAYRLP